MNSEAEMCGSGISLQKRDSKEGRDCGGIDRADQRDGDSDIRLERRDV
jgi:hypothetical protein